VANFVIPSGTGGGGAFQAGDAWEAAEANELRGDFDLLVSGDTGRNRFLGGADAVGIRGSAVVDLIDAVPFTVDNASTQWSGSSGITVQVVVYLRVADASVSVTPRVYNLTSAAVATTTGSAACSATNRDWSGTNQKQTLVLTLASGVNTYVVQATPSAATYPVFAKAWLHLYI
jgi:hypothetical protein